MKFFPSIEPATDEPADDDHIALPNNNYDEISAPESSRPTSIVIPTTKTNTLSNSRQEEAEGINQ